MEFMNQQIWSGFAATALLAGSLGVASAEAAQPSANTEEWTETLSIVKSSSDEASSDEVSHNAVRSMAYATSLPTEAPDAEVSEPTERRFDGMQLAARPLDTLSVSIQVQPHTIQELQTSVSGFDMSTPLDSPEAMAVLLPPLDLPQPVPEPEPERRAVGEQSGMASWYGPGFHGNRSASGEVFDQNALTAAHRTLPFGTQVRVTNLNTGLSVVVRINDRGPFSGGRIIDLSRGAAGEIGMISSGVARVRVEVLE